MPDLDRIAQLEVEGRPTDDEFVWGAAGIGALLNLSERQTFNLLETGKIGPAGKVGKRWVVSKAALFAFMSKLQ